MSKLLKNSNKGKKVGVGGVGGGGRSRHSTLPMTTTTIIPPRNLNYNNQGYKGISAYASSSGSSGGWSECETAAAIMFNKCEGSSGHGRTKRVSGRESSLSCNVHHMCCCDTWNNFSQSLYH
jgi:hypothetical protein